MAKELFDAKRGSHFVFSSPKTQLIVIGHNTQHGSDHPLWRADVNEPLKASFVESLRRRGVIQPIQVRRLTDDVNDNTRAEVVIGRSRARAAQIIEDEGGSCPVPAMVWPKGMSVADIIGMANAENSHRKHESLLVVMEHAWLQIRAEGQHDSAEKNVAQDSGISVQRLRQMLALREAADVLAAYRSGVLGGEMALAIADLPPAERAALLADTLSKGLTTIEVRERAQRTRTAARGETVDDDTVGDDAVAALFDDSAAEEGDRGRGAAHSEQMKDPVFAAAFAKESARLSAEPSKPGKKPAKGKAAKQSRKKAVKAEDVSKGFSLPTVRRFAELNGEAEALGVHPMHMEALRVIAGLDPPSKFKGWVKALRYLGAIA